MDRFEHYIRIIQGSNHIIIDMYEVKAIRKGVIFNSRGGKDGLIITFKDSNEIEIVDTEDNINSILNVFWDSLVEFSE